MITKINIANLGIFRNFNWDSIRDDGNNVVPLKKVNVIYGRNYSGKTTLSRIIRALETKILSDKYEEPSFELTLQNGQTINSNNYIGNALLIRCFNEDFIKENLKFVINHEGEIVPFAILGENTGIEEKIAEIKNELGNKNEGEETLLYSDLKLKKAEVDRISTDVSKLKSTLDSQLSNKATLGNESIKKQYTLFGDINYNISKLKVEISKISNDETEVIDGAKKVVNERLIKEEERTDVKSLNGVYLELNQLHETTKELVQQDIIGSGKIKELLADALLNKWAKEGYQLHKDDKNCLCAFCGNPIRDDRWQELDRHFDEETDKLEKDLIRFVGELNAEIEAIRAKKDPLSKDLFYVEFHERVSQLNGEFNEIIELVITELEDYLSWTESRLKSLFESASFSKILNEDMQKQLDLVVSLINSVIEENNSFTSSLKKKKAIAQVELRFYEISNFMDTIEYEKQKKVIEEKEVLFGDEKDKLLTIELDIDEKEREIEDLSRRLNDEEEGAKRVNHYLNNYFGHQHLELQAIENEVDAIKKIRFNVVRNEKIAYHLSEGEISLISFCYFMAKLDDIHTLGRKPIILIDDPISSLDSNHIFYLYSLINSELFVKERFEQIFISTHNLDFLKYLKRLDLSNLNLGKRDKIEHFIINRITDNSSISLMPSYLKDYITEFNFLFGQIYQCAKADTVTNDNHHLFYNFGNNARKFLEALLFYKYPCRIENQTNNANSKRLLKYFGGDHQAAMLTDRVNNELSHLEEIFDRGMQPIDIPEMKKVAQFILDKIKERDSDQYGALLESIGQIELQEQTVIVTA